MPSLSAAVSFIALLFYCVLLVIVIRRDFKSRLHLSFAIYLVSMVIWSLGSFMIFADLGFLSTLFWNRFMVIGSMGMPVAFFGFAQNFLVKDRRTWLYLGFFSYLVTQTLNLLGLVITNAYIQGGLLYNQYSGAGVVFSSLSWAFFISLLGYDLFREYRNTRDTIYRNRLKYLLIITVLTFAGSLTNVTKLQVFPVDIAFNAVSAILIAYTILRHHFLDINLVVRKGLFYSIPTIVIGATYFLIISFALNLFHAFSGTRLFLLSLFVAIVTALVAQPLRDRAQLFIDRFFFREKYDATLMLQRVSSTVAAVLDLDRLTHLILAEVTTTLQIERAAFFTRQEDSDEFSLIAYLGMDPSAVHLKLGASNPIVLWLVQNQHPLTRSYMDVIPQFKALWGQERYELDLIAAELFIPLLVNGILVGFLALGPKRSGLSFSEDDQLTLTTLTNQTAVAIENARLYDVARQEIQERKRTEEQLQLQFRRLSALHAIELSITTSINLEAPLQVLLDQVISQQQVDAAAVLLLNPNSETLEYAASRGFQTSALQFTKLKLGEGLAGQAAKEQTIIKIPDLTKIDTPLSKSHLLLSEHFVAYFGVPLVAKGQIKGVLEVFHHSKLDPSAEWLDFLESLATQAAVVLDNVSLFNDLQESNIALEQAYKNTLEGWSSALELRDHETEGHSQRVTELTLFLAQRLGINGEELTHISRGALLHDIGKMGIPDNLLQKPGPLTVEEAKVMQQHPAYAYELLSSIPFLHPALDIPFCHHEKWDGTGYPRGLKEEEIPLSARIFAVADVWDALLSDRPYRNAWSREEAMNYIREQPGKHFDPRVVEVFLEFTDRMDQIRKNLTTKADEVTSLQSV